MANKDLSGLLELGLNEKEARLYLAAIKSGAGTAQVLALESGIKRATVYSCIDSLIAKGLLHTEINGVRKLFIPEPPEKLTTLLEQKKQALTNLLPQLTQQYLHASPHKSNIKIYHSLSGIKSVYDHILEGLTANDEYLVISDRQKWYSLDPIYFENFRKKRDNLGLTVKLIVKHHIKNTADKANAKKTTEKIKLLPIHIDLNTSMVILPNKVIITQTIEPLLTVLIENQSICEMNKTLFNVIWELLP